MNKKAREFSPRKRLAQEASRRASAAESSATLVFGRLNRHQCAFKLRESLLSWPRRMRPSYVSSSARLSINSNHRQPRASAA